MSFIDSKTDVRAAFVRAGIPLEMLGIESDGYAKFWHLVQGVRQACLRFKPDAVLCFPFGWHSYVAWGAKLARVTTIVCHAGNHPLPEGASRVPLKLFLTVGLARPLRPKVICCSDYVKDGIQRYLPMPSEDLHVVANGIRMNRFARLTPRRAASDHRVRVGMIGRTDFTKDYPTLLKAIASLKKRRMDVELEIAGDGAGRLDLERLAADFGLEEEVRFLGTRSDIPTLLESWDLFVYSVKPFEGLGVALIEAIAAGVPVICSDVPGCRQVMIGTRGEALGEFARVSDPASMAEKIEDFASNRKRWWVRADSSRVSIGQKFCIEEMAKRYLEVLRS